MAENLSSAMSPIHRDIIQAAVAAALGDVRIDAIRVVGGWASGAFPFRVDVRGRRYLVRVEGEPSPLRNPHQYTSMRIAAEAGIAPRLHHVDEAVRVAVMDFIEEQPLSSFPGGAEALAHAVGLLLARVQATSPFPRFVAYPDMVSRLWDWVCRTGLFAAGVLDRHTDHLRCLCETYRWDGGNAVSSHNDPVPRNVLFDGRRLWMIDWESACCNDPLVDVAIVLDSFALPCATEPGLLQSWLGYAPNDSVLARLSLVRAFTRLYYAGVFLSAAAAVLGPREETTLAVPTALTFQAAIRDGTLDPEAPDTKLTLGKMYLDASLTGKPPPGIGAIAHPS